MAGALLIWYLSVTLVEALPLETTSRVGTDRWVTALLFLGLTLLMVWAARRYLDRRPWSGLRLTGPREAWWPLLVGTLSWAVPGLLGLALAAAVGISITPAAPLAEILLSLLVLAVVVLLSEAVPEELVFRGHLFRNLNTAMATWLAVAVQALLFGFWGTALWVITEGWETVGERLPMFLGMGVVLGCIRVLTDNLWACVGFHVAFQTAAQGLLGWELFEVSDEDGVMRTLLLAPFVLGVLTAMLLLRTTGRWNGRVADPVEG
ncbi:CPBP family intramembrane glutamic endopeptidase [Nocardiopsis ganjiahuensis]|uniref:CPBP family intramembrane glutamic endopeptidase n=1 Tax=Nocardiopsis ganjiahuensis TaxID=239984 RepID=UPI00034A91E4|nr:CPBP family intramembrane glutamic endopeptidase [Nocardiopsis ganjiahuensis]